MDIYKIYSAGHFIDAGSPLEVKNPFDGNTFASTFLAGEKELESSIVKALSVASILRELPVYTRYKILSEIAEAITGQRKELALLLCRESGKPLRYALAEIDRAAQTFNVAAEESRRLPKEYLSLDWTPAGEGKEGIVKYFPVGPVAAISPFNFPLNLAVHKIAPAIAAGCPVILKPASSTPLSTLALAKIIDKTELPKGAVSILPMDRHTGNKLVTDERFKLLSFTGSPAVGWQMKKNAGKKKVILELGGNAAVIICASADVASTVKKALVAGFAYSGQVCIHAQRFFIHEDLYDQFLTLLVTEIKKLKRGDPQLPDTDIAEMIDNENAERVENWIREAVEQGAKLEIGGKRQGSFVEPAILSNVKEEMKVCREEVFGPVITVTKYSSLEEAIELVNTSTFGLQAGIFSNSRDEIQKAFNNIEVGGLIVNDMPNFRVDHMPYGGVKDSGLGREGVRYSILDMMEPRILVQQS
jgi:glyceraldehyde-3-phosphate dehydrogenase (NADP+)